MKFFGLLFAVLLLISWASPVVSGVFGTHDCISIHKGECFRWNKCLPFYDMLGKCDRSKICCKKKEDRVRFHHDGTTRKRVVSIKIEHSSTSETGGW